MIFFRLLWATLILVLVVGIGTAVLMSLETMSPGLPEDAMSAARRYSFASSLHSTTMAISFPIAAIGGLTSFLLAERYMGRAANWILNACGSVIIALAVLALFFSDVLRDYASNVRNFLIPLSCAFLVGLLLLRHRARNASAFIFCGASIVPFFVYSAYQGLYFFDPEVSALSDTYAATAVLHSLGLAVILLVFSCLSVWSYARGARLNGWVSTACAATLMLSARGYVSTHLGAGLSGMPRRYADYPQSFAQSMESASWLGLAYASLVLLILGRFFIAVWYRDRSTAADEF